MNELVVLGAVLAMVAGVGGPHAQRRRSQAFALLRAIPVVFLVWGEIPDAWMLAGVAVVVASGTYMIPLTAPPR